MLSIEFFMFRKKTIKTISKRGKTVHLIPKESKEDH